MTKTLENISTGDVSRVLAEKGIPPDKPVTVVMNEDLADIARRTRATAKARGLTEATHFSTATILLWGLRTY